MSMIITLTTFFVKKLRAGKKYIGNFIRQKQQWREKTLHYIGDTGKHGVDISRYHARKTGRGVLWLEKLILRLSRFLFTGILWLFSSLSSAIMVMLAVILLHQNHFSINKNPAEIIEGFVNRNQDYAIIQIKGYDIKWAPLAVSLKLKDIALSFSKASTLMIPEINIVIRPWMFFVPGQDALSLQVIKPDLQLFFKQQSVALNNSSDVFDGRIIGDFLSSQAVGWLPKILVKDARLSFTGRTFDYSDLRGNFLILADGDKVSWEGDILFPKTANSTPHFLIRGRYESDYQKLFHRFSFKNVPLDKIEKMIFDREEAFTRATFLVEGQLDFENSFKDKKNHIALSLQQEQNTPTDALNKIELKLTGDYLEKIRSGSNLDVVLSVEDLQFGVFKPFYQKFFDQTAWGIPDIQAKIDGEIRLQSDEKAHVKNMAFVLSAQQATLEWKNIFETRAIIQSLDIEGFHNKVTGKGMVRLDPVLLQDEQGEAIFSISWNNEAVGTGWNVVFEGGVKNFVAKNLSSYWPRFLKRKARDWVVSNISNLSHVGRVKQADIQGGFVLGDGLSFQKQSLFIKGGFDFNNLTFRYLDGFPDVSGVSGEAVFDMDQINFALKEANSLGIDLQQGNFSLSKVGVNKAGKAKINMVLDFDGSGTIDDHKKITEKFLQRYFDKEKLPIPKLEGKAVTKLSLSMPLGKNIKKDEIDFNIETKLEGIRNRSLLFDNGEALITVDGQKLSVDGQVNVAGSPVDFSLKRLFTRQLGKPWQDIMVEGRLMSNSVVQGFIPILSEDVSGDMILKGRWKELNDGRRLADINLDISAVAFDIKEIFWKKNIGSEGKIHLKGEGTAVKGMSYDLDIAWPQLQTSVLLETDPKGRLVKLFLPSTEWPNNRLEINYDRGEDHLLVASGTTINFSRLIKRLQAKEGRGRSLKLGKDFSLQAHINFENLQITPKFLVPDANVIIQKNSDETLIHLTSRYDSEEDALIIARFTESEDTIEAMISNIGSFLEFSSFSEELKGGSLSVNGYRGVDQDSYQGTLQLENMTIYNAPIFLHIFSALALVVGSPDVFADGFLVRKGEAAWQYGDGILKIDFLNFGNFSQRIGMEGVIDFNQKILDLHGQYVPLLPLTLVLERIPLVGSLLVGGKTDGFAGISYSIKGPLDAPKTDVKPLSFLSPGALKLLFQDIRKRKRDNKSRKEKQKPALIEEKI